MHPGRKEKKTKKTKTKFSLRATLRQRSTRKTKRKLPLATSTWSFRENEVMTTISKHEAEKGKSARETERRDVGIPPYSVYDQWCHVTNAIASAVSQTFQRRRDTTRHDKVQLVFLASPMTCPSRSYDDA